MVEQKQKILTSISKLADRDTYQIAVEDLEKTIQSLTPETLPMFLNCLYDSCSDPKPAVKKECLHLLSYVCSLHSDSTAVHLTRIIAQIVKRLKDPDSGVRDACRDTIGALSGIYLKGREEGSNTLAVGLFVKPLFEAMGEQNKVVQSGAAMCMARMVESAATPPVASFQKLCPRICKLLSSSSFLAKASLLPVVSSLSQVGAIAPQSLESLLESIHDCLGSTDWVTRKAAAETLTSLASHSSSLLKDRTDSTLAALETCRFDKIKPVRETVTEALQLWKKISGKCLDGAPDESKSSSGEQLGSEKNGDKRSNLSDLMKKEVSDGSILSPDSASKAKGGLPEKAAVMLKKKAPVLSDKDFNPEFFQRLERRQSVEVVVPRRCKNEDEEELGQDDLNAMGSSNRFKNLQSNDHGFPDSKFHNIESGSHKKTTPKPNETNTKMAVEKSNTTVDGVSILKPRTDNREYRKIVLKNSLQVLLISDPDTDKCAASMSVSIGSFSDPQGLEGLAHFLEHMLFYASAKYPEEDSYSKYITEHGGSTNAYTSSEETNYHFDINADCFSEALDRFAQFFIKPLMSAEATMREIKAVDSENQKNLLSDGWRMRQLQKHLSKEDHPFHKFSTGNMDTLHVKPQAKGVDTTSELIKFYEEHYSANIMHLVVYGKESLDKIQDLVEGMFQEVQNTNKTIPRFPGQPCTSDHLQILVKAVPIKQGHKINVSWPVTPSIHRYEEAPCRYLGHLIGHEGEGSLFHALKTLGWATGLSAGEGDWTLDYSFFTVSIELTDAGHEHMQDILGLLFKYIQLLQQTGVCQWIFDELAAICETKFHYQDKTPPMSYIVDIASNLQIFPTRDWLVGLSLPSKFNPATIQKVVDELSPSNARIFWESQKFEGQTDKNEPWYNTAYSLEKITSSTIQEWVKSAPDVNLHLPAPNVFIPTDLSLKDVKNKETVPVLLRNSPFSRLWYKPDTIFSKPKAYFKMDFNCPLAVSSPDAAVLTDIFTRLLMDYLNEYAYYAQVAGLHYGVSLSDNGFELTLLGYNHKLRILLDTVIEKIANFEVKPDRFAVIKETVTKEYQNDKFRQPYHQAMYYCSLILQDQTWPWTEELEVLSHLEAEDVAKFVPMLLSRTFIECYIAGNVEDNEAESMVKHVEDVLFNDPKPKCRPLFPSQHLTNRVVKLEEGMKYFYHQDGSNPSDENSALVHYIQVHRDEFAMNIKLQLFGLVAKQATFHQLRTVEQLGYITALAQRNDSGIYGVQFIIQSSVKGPGHIDSRVELLLKNFESKLREMSDEEFKSNVTALIDMKLEKYKNLKEESRFYWQEIQRGTLKFNRKEAEVVALRQLQKQELIDFFEEYIKIGAAKKKSLSIRVYGSQHLKEMASDKDEVPSPSVEIEDIVGFRKAQPLHGSFRGCGQPKL